MLQVRRVTDHRRSKRVADVVMVVFLDGFVQTTRRLIRTEVNLDVHHSDRANAG
jgi:hypothetical protein